MKNINKNSTNALLATLAVSRAVLENLEDELDAAKENLAATEEGKRVATLSEQIATEKSAGKKITKAIRVATLSAYAENRDSKKPFTGVTIQERVTYTVTDEVAVIAWAEANLSMAVKKKLDMGIIKKATVLFDIPGLRVEKKPQARISKAIGFDPTDLEPCEWCGRRISYLSSVCPYCGKESPVLPF